MYRYKGRTPDEKFGKYDNAFDLIDQMKNGEIKLAEAENDQTNFKWSLGKINKGNKKKKIKGAKKHTIQYWHGLQSKKWGY